MAITTTQQLVSSVWKSLPMPDADVTDNGDLQHSLWQYAGVLADPVPQGSGRSRLPGFQHMNRYARAQYRTPQPQTWRYRR